MNKEELINEVRAWGFHPLGTASRKWYCTLVRQTPDKSMLILVRRGGIDVLESTRTLAEMTNASGELSVSTKKPGDRFVELAYTDADTSIHDLALQIASKFAQELPIDDEYFKRRGIGPGEWARTYGRRSGAGNGRTDIGEIYEAVRAEDGEDAYLSDGVWIRSDGTTYHR